MKFELILLIYHSALLFKNSKKKLKKFFFYLWVKVYFVKNIFLFVTDLFIIIKKRL